MNKEVLIGAAFTLAAVAVVMIVRDNLPETKDSFVLKQKPKPSKTDIGDSRTT